MKFLPSQIAYLFTDREAKANLRALGRYLAFLVGLVALYAVAFHVIKLQVEHETHSWVTGVYWTLVVMTTLGFGDITFTSDIGRVFSIIVLISGVVFLLVMLPFLFIRLFYGPWLEARMRFQVPREVPEGTRGHVIIVEHDAIAAGLIERCTEEGIPYVVIEPDPVRAVKLLGEGLTVIAGENDSRLTYERAAAAAARLVLANCEDTANTNITLTVREVAPEVTIAAVAEEHDSIDILELSGATRVLPLKEQLGASLAERVHARPAEAHVVGHFGALEIAELPAQDTPYAGMRVRDTGLRPQTGTSIVGLWERGRLRPAFADSEITAASVLVVAGTSAQVAALKARLPDVGGETPPVLIIGAGKVGHAAAVRLREKGLRVHAVDRTDGALSQLAGVADATFAGDAADRTVLERAGLLNARSVVLTTNDDAMNIYLAVYCRRLNPHLRIVSRITHARNLEAMHRAGADFVLSYTTLGVGELMPLLGGDPPVMLGEGVELFSLPVTASLAGRTLAQSAIGSRTGLSVLALMRDGQLTAPLPSDLRLPAGAELIVLGSDEQRASFNEAFPD